MSSFHSKYKDSDSASIGLSFIKAYNLWHKMIKEELNTINLTHPQFVVLASLGYLSQNHEEINQVTISKQSDIDVMTVSTIIKNLEKSMLIMRKESKTDSRAKSVHLTKKGQIVLNKALPLVEEIDTRFFDALNSQKELFNNLLQTLTRENIK
ncbi:MarR family transcriptional regulator [Enterococcus faecalis]|nr:MarR family transcriptional regulator [Enterococcus faecalis]